MNELLTQNKDQTNQERCARGFEGGRKGDIKHKVKGQEGDMFENILYILYIIMFVVGCLTTIIFFSIEPLTN